MFDGPELFAALASREDHDGILFDPAFARVPPVAEGVDERPGAGVLQARTAAEIHLWLDLMGARREGRRHVVEQRPEGPCVVYQVRWDRTDWGRPAFTTCDRPDVEDLGDGPSRILCAGLLVEAVRARLRRPRLRRGAPARWLGELEKQGDRLPRSAIRTAEGAWTFRRRPECTTREWVVACCRWADTLATQ